MLKDVDPVQGDSMVKDLKEVPAGQSGDRFDGSHRHGTSLQQNGYFNVLHLHNSNQLAWKCDHQESGCSDLFSILSYMNSLKSTPCLVSACQRAALHCGTHGINGSGSWKSDDVQILVELHNCLPQGLVSSYGRKHSEWPHKLHLHSLKMWQTQSGPFSICSVYVQCISIIFPSP